MSDELNAIKEEKTTIMLGGVEREIKFGFSAWAILEDEYGSLAEFRKITDQLKNKPFHTVPHLIYVGLRDKKDIQESDVNNWLDDYGIGDIKMLSDILTKALNVSLPKVEVKKENPQKAGKK